MLAGSCFEHRGWGLGIGVGNRGNPAFSCTRVAQWGMGNFPKIELISQDLGVGIGVVNGIGIDIEMSTDDSTLDPESDSDPDTDREEPKHSRQIVFIRSGAPQARGRMLRNHLVVLAFKEGSGGRNNGSL
jgi:hypothetical protein